MTLKIHKRNTPGTSSHRLVCIHGLSICATSARSDMVKIEALLTHDESEEEALPGELNLHPAAVLNEPSSLHFTNAQEFRVVLIAAFSQASFSLHWAAKLAQELLPAVENLPAGLKVLHLSHQASLFTTSAQQHLFASLANHLKSDEEAFIQSCTLALKSRKDSIDCLIAAGHLSDQSGSAQDAWFTLLELMQSVKSFHNASGDIQAQHEWLLTARALAAKGLYEVGMGAQRQGGGSSSSKTVKALLSNAALWQSWLLSVDATSAANVKSEVPVMDPNREEVISEAQQWLVELLGPTSMVQ